MRVRRQRHAGESVDGYISGEGERGLMIRSRLDHAYYSMAAACHGTMWTAAFPEYGQAVMRPFLAATGQSPHAPLGYEMPSSSLAHPPVPVFSDVTFRPLWKLWRLMRHERDLNIRNDYNCSGVFPHSEDVSHYLMATANIARTYLDEIAAKKKIRAGIGTAEQCYLRIRIPELSLAYEASMVIDLYDNRLEFGEVVDGEFRRYGYLGTQGFQKEMTAPEDFVENGGESDWIPPANRDIRTQWSAFSVKRNPTGRSYILL